MATFDVSLAVDGLLEERVDKQIAKEFRDGLTYLRKIGVAGCKNMPKEFVEIITALGQQTVGEKKKKKDKKEVVRRGSYATSTGEKFTRFFYCNLLSGARKYTTMCSTGKYDVTLEETIAYFRHFLDANNPW